MHQQELQLNNPKINSDKQLTARLNWVVWLIGSISGNIIIPRFLCHSYVKKWKEPPLLDILGHDNWRGAGLGTEPENTQYYVWPTTGSLSPSCPSALSKGPAATEQWWGPGCWDLSQAGLRGLIPGITALPRTPPQIQDRAYDWGNTDTQQSSGESLF